MTSDDEHYRIGIGCEDRPDNVARIDHTEFSYDTVCTSLEGAIVADSPEPGIAQGKLPTRQFGERAPHFGKLYRLEDGAVLVRPDGYIMRSSSHAVANSGQALDEIFQQVLGKA